MDIEKLDVLFGNLAARLARVLSFGITDDPFSVAVAFFGAVIITSIMLPLYIRTYLLFLGVLKQDLERCAESYLARHLP